MQPCCFLPPGARRAPPLWTRAPRRLEALRTADSTLQVAVAARDVAGTLALYADDAVLLPLAKPIAEGRDAIRKEWEHSFGIPGFVNSSRLTAADVSLDGTMGVTRGTYEATMKAPDGETVVERGKWVSVWRRAAGGPWRITTDIYNTDSLPPDHQPSAADAHDHSARHGARDHTTQLAATTCTGVARAGRAHC